MFSDDNKNYTYTLDNSVASCHEVYLPQSSNDHLEFLTETYCMQTQELWIDSHLRTGPPTLQVPLAAIQSWPLCKTIMISFWCVSGPSMEAQKEHTCIISHLPVKLKEKVGTPKCFQSYNSSEKLNCILNSWMNNGNLKAIISKFYFYKYWHMTLNY